MKDNGSVAKTPFDKVQNIRNDMYLASEALRVLDKDKESELTADEKSRRSATYKKDLDNSTKFIPTWVKVSVAIALGLGTMVGWKRIVVTVGEKIGKTHLTYGQGAAAEIVAAATIGAADGLGLPVSTTHVLSSGVAGTMLANGSGMQWSTAAQHRARLGADPAGGDHAVGRPVLRSSANLLTCRSRPQLGARAVRAAIFVRLTAVEGDGSGTPTRNALSRAFKILAASDTSSPSSARRHRRRAGRARGRSRSRRIAAKLQVDLGARRRVAVFALVIELRNLDRADWAVRSRASGAGSRLSIAHVEFEIIADQRPAADETQQGGQHFGHRAPRRDVALAQADES